MLNCILGMVEKTQRAITILQQRQQSSSQQFNNQRSPEDIIDEVSLPLVFHSLKLDLKPRLQSLSCAPGP